MDAVLTQVTGQLLSRWQSGDDTARDRLIGKLYPALLQIAAAQIRKERNSSLSTGDLVNEAVLNLIRMEGVDIRERAHFLALASRIMRHVLVDRARAKLSAKRKHLKVELHTRIDGDQRMDLNELDTALVRLAVIDSELMELVEMRYFGGMTVADVSEVMGLSEATVKRRWNAGRAWLTDALSKPLEYA